MPVYGELIRPLERKYKDKTLAATTPDEIQSWEEYEHTIRAEIWRGLVLPDCAPDAHNQIFDVYAIHDPNFDTPWLLATSVVLKPSSVRNIYKDRWPVEQISLSAKQMLGSHRQFVHAEETIQRLPELALIAGSILSFLAATLPATPTGFWDRKPKRTPRSFSPHPRRTGIFQICHSFRTTSKKEFGYFPFTRRTPGANGKNRLSNSYFPPILAEAKVYGFEKNISLI